MIKLKGVTVKETDAFEGRNGYGFAGDIYMDDKLIGDIRDEADGSMIRVSIEAKQRKRFDERIENIIAHFSQTDNKDEHFLFYLDLHETKEIAVLDYIYTLSTVVPTIQSILDEGKDAFMLSCLHPLTSDNWDEYFSTIGELRFVGTTDKRATPELLLKSFQERNDASRFNYARKISDLSDLSVK